MLDPREAEKIVRKDFYPALRAERQRLERIDDWLRDNHDKPHKPRQATAEYRELQERAPAPWPRLVVTTVAQMLYVDGYRSESDTDNADAWDFWQRNNMDRHQVGLHYAALGYGLAYTTVLPGVDMFQEPLPIIHCHSPRRMIAFYQDPAHDDWPEFALQLEPATIWDGKKGWTLFLYDDQRVHRILCDEEGKTQYVEFQEHGAGVCPVVRYANQLDLEGRADGEVEPFIPLFAKIDQTSFDRLVVQRFASWVVRTIAGMAKPENVENENANTLTEPVETVEQARMRLKVEDLLVAEDPDTKFGTLAASPLQPFIEAYEADVRVLAAVSQTPAHEMLGQMANLSAEALAAARASLTAKKDERQITLGDSHEQTLRLACHIAGDEAGARDLSAQVRWRDTEIRSLAQAADALGKIATMLGFPVELLWEKIPGMTQQDIDAAEARVAAGDSMTQLLGELTAGQASASPNGNGAFV